MVLAKKATRAVLHEELSWATIDAHTGWLLWERVMNATHPEEYPIRHTVELSECQVPACASRYEIIHRG